MNILPKLLIFIGIIIFLIGLAIFLKIYYPILRAEYDYFMLNNNNFKMQIKTVYKEERVIKPINDQFALVIPKINANAPVIADVDPLSGAEYQNALTKGVAHVKGTVYPGQVGNIFIFSHSTSTFFEATHYNAVFYLLYKLEINNIVILYFQGKKFVYKVTDKKIVNSTDISFLNRQTNQKILTLMTGWPPGTTFKRLLIMGQLVED